ncbi:hypothetical protein HK097_004775 [Rhizophlyctis rosea]|uniref:Uncharacterized protein n=1 Tax=Rhizophlyctis rosea TaxID=64517 RepID=A0AAD5SDU9_9FUNG|nr:hypothetical protein HK097_004775 [Rhizophlyctis rosea]
MAQPDTRAPLAPSHQPKPQRHNTGGDANPRGPGVDNPRGAGNAKGQRQPRRSTRGGGDTGGQGGPADRSGDTQGSSSARRGRGGGQSGRGGRRGDNGAQSKEHNPNRTNGQALSRKQSQLSLVPENTPVPVDLTPIKKIVMSSFPPEDPSMMGVDNEIEPYVEWVTASLQEHDSMEVLGVDPVIPNMVAVILILRNSKTIIVESLGTLTLDGPGKSPQSALRALIRRGPVLDQELTRKQKLQRKQSGPKPPAQV